MREKQTARSEVRFAMARDGITGGSGDSRKL